MSTPGRDELRDYAWAIGYAEFFDELWENEQWLLRTAEQTPYDYERRAALIIARRKRDAMRRMMLGIAIRRFFEKRMGRR